MYFPDEFKSFFGMTRLTCELFTHEVMATERIPLGNGSGELRSHLQRKSYTPSCGIWLTKSPLEQWQPGSILHLVVWIEFWRVSQAAVDLSGRFIRWPNGECKWQNITTKALRTNLVSGRWSGSHVDYVDSGHGETGPEQEGSNGTEYPVIPIFRNIGLAQKVVHNFRKFFRELFPFHWISDRKSRKFWPNGKRSMLTVKVVIIIFL